MWLASFHPSARMNSECLYAAYSSHHTTQCQCHENIENEHESTALLKTQNMVEFRMFLTWNINSNTPVRAAKFNYNHFCLHQLKKTPAFHEWQNTRLTLQVHLLPFYSPPHIPTPYFLRPRLFFDSNEFIAYSVTQTVTVVCSCDAEKS